VIPSTPTATEQARFVGNLQRLLTEGEFVNTYKFALLISLARWATENPTYDEKVPLDVRALAPHFAELYWPHVQPFVLPGGASLVSEDMHVSTSDHWWHHILVQDRGERSEHQVPRVLKEIRHVQQAGATHLHRLEPKQRDVLLSKVRKSIATMPLWKLQRVRDSIDPISFLYRQRTSGYEVEFEPGIVACLAHFAPLVEDVVRSAWLRHVLRCNGRLLGATAQVESFLFPDSRASLEAWRGSVQAVQGDACFYCDEPIGGTPVVDHFLPWTRYRRDLGHNFVLAHDRCNQAKSDHLASCEHLERWCRRNEQHGRELAIRFDAAQLPHDWQTLRHVATSLYRLAEANGSLLWQRGKELIAIDGRWRSILSVA
jgi:hypothetical protein